MSTEIAGGPATKIRILLADDHPSLRMGLGLILNNEQDMEVVAEAETGEEALELYRKHRPTITLMDLKMAESSGVDSILSIRKEFPAAKIIVLTTYDRDEDIYRSIRAGAMGYLVKDAAYDEIIQTIRTVYSGRKHYPSKISEKLAERLMMPDLSEREMEVLRLMARGESNKEIADELSLALGTVKYHINNIYTKLAVEDRTQAVVTALRKGLAEL
jgi:two-component system NarL family response regulator